jgi:hypothetical protein
MDRLRLAVMSAKNPKPESTRTILKKGNGAYVVVLDEGGVTRIYRLHIVKSNSPKNYIAEPDRPRVVLKAAITDVFETTSAATTADVAAIADTAVADLATITDMASDALERPDVASAIPDYAWSTQLHPLKDPPEQ